MATACLLVLCGLPAAGKTTFITCFKSYLQSKISYLPTVRCTTPMIDQASFPELCLSLVVVSYDQLMPAELEAHLVAGYDATKTGSSKQWKLYRRSILHCIERLILQPLSSFPPPINSEGSPLEEKIIDESRSVPNTAVSLPLHHGATSDAHSSRCHDVGGRVDVTEVSQELLSRFSSLVLGELRPTPPLLVVIDDNMYYAGMRYEVFQLARRYGAGFAQLYFPVSASEAVERNSRRELLQQVPHDVIEDMARRLEPPRGAVNSWEQRSAETSGLEAGGATDDHAELFEKVLALVSSAFNNPVLPPSDLDTAVEESRAACLASTVHCADMILRKLIGQRMASFKVSAEKAELSEIARRLNTCRIELLDETRTGRLTFPSDISDHPQSQNIDAVNDSTAEISKGGSVGVNVSQDSSQRAVSDTRTNTSRLMTFLDSELTRRISLLSAD